jgi:hypothetical protein
MIRIPLDVDNGSGSCFSGVNDHTAADGTVAADARRLLGEANLERLGVGFDRFQVKSQTQSGNARRRSTRDLEKIATRDVHGTSFLWVDWVFTGKSRTCVEKPFKKTESGHVAFQVVLG